MAFKQKGFPITKGTKKHKSALKQKDDDDKKKEARKWVHGQETGEVKKTKKGEDYALIGKGDSSLDPGDKLYGDTLVIPKDYKHNIMQLEKDGRKDLKDLDYDIEKIGPKKHKITGGYKWTKEIKEKAEESMKKPKSPSKHGRRVTPVKHGRGRKGHVN